MAELSVCRYTCSCGGTASMCSSMNSALRILWGTVSRWSAPQACGPTLSSRPGVPAKALSARDRNIVTSTALITLSIHPSCASRQFTGSLLCRLLLRAPFRRQTSLALTCNQSAEPGISFMASYRLFSKDVAIRRIRTVVSGNRHLLEEDAVHGHRLKPKVIPYGCIAAARRGSACENDRNSCKLSLKLQVAAELNAIHDWHQPARDDAAGLFLFTGAEPPTTSACGHDSKAVQ